MPSFESTTRSSIVLPSRSYESLPANRPAEADNRSGAELHADPAPSFRVTEAASLASLIEALLPRQQTTCSDEFVAPHPAAAFVEPPLASLPMAALADDRSTPPVADAIAAEELPGPVDARRAATTPPTPDQLAERREAADTPRSAGAARLAALIAEQRRLIERMAEVSARFHAREPSPDESAECDRTPLSAIAFPHGGGTDAHRGEVPDSVATTVTAAPARTAPPPLPPLAGITEPTLVSEPDPAATGLVRAIAAAGRFLPAVPAVARPDLPPSEEHVPAPGPDEPPAGITIPETMAAARTELAPSPLPAFLSGMALSTFLGAVLYALLVLA